MANKISVVIDVAVDRANRSLKSFRQSIKDADTASGKFKAGASSAFTGIQANAGTMALVAGTAIAAFGAKSVAAFQDTALSAGKLRDSLGVTSEEASRLQEVAEDLGIGTATLERSLGIMNRTATNTPDAFKSIGAELKRNADGTTNVNATFLSTIEALNQIPDASARAAAAQKVFGRSWMDMAELIKLGAGGVSKALASVGDEKIIDDAEVEKARAFRDSMDNLRDSFEEVQIAVGGALVPALTKAAEVASSVAIEARNADEATSGWLGNLAQMSKRGAENLFPFLKASERIAIMNDETKRVTDSMRRYEEEVARASDATSIQAAQAAHLASVAEEATKVTQKSAEAIEKETAAREESIESLMEAADSSLAFRNQQADTTAAIQAANSTMARSVVGSAEYEQAARDAEAAVMAQADAAVRLAEDQATANGAVFSAEDRAVTYQAELERLAAQLSGPARAAIQGYINELNRIPRRVDTQVALNMPRRGPAAGGTSVYGAEGGIVNRPTVALIGEAGPEAVVPLHKTPGNGPLPSGLASGGNVYNSITINTGADPEAVVNAIKKYSRRNGPGSVPL